jgi:single-stranded DNA-specific DHH superfamily exonuclease
MTVMVKWVIPPADAVVDPHQAGDAYPYKPVCGAVVAWKVSRILMEMLCPDTAAAVSQMLMGGGSAGNGMRCHAAP